MRVMTKTAQLKGRLSHGAGEATSTFQTNNTMIYSLSIRVPEHLRCLSDCCSECCISCIRGKRICAGGGVLEGMPSALFGRSGSSDAILEYLRFLGLPDGTLGETDAEFGCAGAVLVCPSSQCVP